MASITDTKTASGRAFTAQVRIRGLKAVSRTFNAADFKGDAKAARKAAQAWGEAREQELRDLQRRQGDMPLPANIGTLTFAQLVEQHLADESVAKLASFETVRQRLNWWVKRFGSVRAIEFPNAQRLQAARDELREHGGTGRVTAAGKRSRGPLDAATANRYLACARRAWNWARNRQLVPKDSVWPGELMLREPDGRKRYLTATEVDRALEAARKEEVIGGTMMRTAVMFAVGVGCRQGEQLRVKWGDVDERKQTVGLVVTKTKGTSRLVHCPPVVLEALRELRQASNVKPMPSRLIFADAEGNAIKQHVLIDAWQRLRIRAGLRDVRWHDLRHSAASFLVAGGSTLEEVAAQLGHRQLSTTRRYSHLAPGWKPTGAGRLDEILRGGGK